MTPAEIEKRRSDDLTNADRASDNAENHRHNLATEETARISAERPRAGAGTGEFSTDNKRGYDAFVENYNTRNPTETTEMVEEYKDGPKKPVKTPVKGVLPPPSIEKWSAMTPAERQAVLANPNARISDADLATRSKSGKAETSTPPPIKAAAASAAGMIIVTKPGTRQKFAFKTQAQADAALRQWASETKK